MTLLLFRGLPEANLTGIVKSIMPLTLRVPGVRKVVRLQQLERGMQLGNACAQVGGDDLLAASGKLLQIEIADRVDRPLGAALRALADSDVGQNQDRGDKNADSGPNAPVIPFDR